MAAPQREELTIGVDAGGVESVRALLDLPGPRAAASDVAVLLAHGAGAPCDSPFMQAVATGLAERGHAVLRFDYPWFERARRLGKRRPPDRAPVLEAAHRAALDLLRARFGGRRHVLGGKSLGGRMASRIAAAGAPCDALFFLGYPLHAPGKSESPRTEHWPALRVPALFLSGTRDALCKLDVLERELPSYAGAATLELVDGADHDFKVPKASGRTREDVLAGLVTSVDGWLRRG